MPRIVLGHSVCNGHHIMTGISQFPYNCCPCRFINKKTHGLGSRYMKREDIFLS